MSRNATSPPRVAVIGAGRAGGTLGVLLAAAGWPVTAIWSRRAGRARTVARRIAARSSSTPRSTTVLGRATTAADCVLIAVPDQAIDRTAQTLAALSPAAPRVVLHLSGSRGAEALESLRSAGSRVGSCHPLAVLPAAPPAPDLLRDTLFAYDGDGEAEAVARRVAGALGGRPVQLNAADRVTYHLAAALVANDTVALFQMASELMQRCGLERRLARLGLARLLVGTADALLREPPEDALTGPVSRGDVETLRRHLDAAPEPGARIHRLLSAELLRLTRRRGRVPASAVLAMKRLLSKD